MEAPQFAYLLATSLRPVLRQTAHQLTLLGLTADTEEFSTKWLGSPNSYDRLSGLSLLEIASVVNSLEFGLGLQECVYQDDWQDAQTERDRWQTRVRLSALRL
ncbi:MAG: hypothetical protein ACOH2L_16950 [Devosia sp.]